MELKESSMDAYSKISQTIMDTISSVEGDDLQELLQEVIGLCRDIADDRDLFVESEELEESSVYNTKSKEEYDNIEDFNSAINDDASTVSNVLEDLKSKMNTDESVEILETHKRSINSDFLDKIYK